MRCLTHRKDTEGDCIWCGRHLCENCIARREGKKFYCERCAVQLPADRPRVPAAKPAAAPAAGPNELGIQFR
jgi:hypothetical protein